ncbi:MAG: hypothetical protein K2I42_05385 [Anaeroplasmataceae bacterium]|nr:hypothetical protein [Anaeroplasmataceae bacterium]
MRNPIKSYNFWLKILGAALLITLGVWLIIDVNTGENFAVFIVLMFTGLVAGIFSIIRAIPLLRTAKTGKARFVSIIEIAIHIGLSIAMIFGAIAKISNEDSDFANFVYKYYRFVIAFYLYSSIVSYFCCTVLCKEETDKIKFWTHIGILTLTCVICAIEFKGQTIAWIIAVLALAVSLGLIIEGGMGYNRYRKTILKEREIKKSEEQEENQIDAPAREEKEPIEDEGPIIIPMIDDPSSTNDEIQ